VSDGAASAPVLPLRSKRRTRAQMVQKLQHVLPAALLIVSAMSAFRGGEEGAARVIAIVEAIAAVAFIASVAYEVRKSRRKEPGHPHAAHAIDWPDVLVSLVFFAEALERWHRRGKIFNPPFLTGVGMLALGLLHGRIFGAVERHRSLRIDDTGISIGKRPFGKFRAPWDALRTIEIDARYARITRRDGGERRIDLHDVEEAGPVRRALEDARRRLGERNGASGDARA
jgi:hypothetical protein